MPYARAHYFLAALLPLIGLAFWPFYFSRLAESPLAIHAHGVTASAWLLLLILQSWAIHHRRTDLHRAAGRASFILFPLFLVGGLMVLHTMARALAAAANPFQDAFGAGLGAHDLLAVATFAWLYYSALRQRRNVQLHARCMLATPLLLLAPIFSRVFVDHVPGLKITGPETLSLFTASLYLANALTLAVALALYAGAPRFGRPFLVVAVMVLLQCASFGWLNGSPAWRAFYGSLGSLPVAVPVVLGLLAGTAIVWWGWRGPQPKGGRRPLPETA